MDRTTDIEMIRTEMRAVAATIFALSEMPRKTQGQFDACDAAQARYALLLNDLDAAQARLDTITAADCFPSLDAATKAVR